MSETQEVAASWLWTGTEPPRQKVTLEITDGRISDIRQGVESATDLAIVPPIVNAHTHLELSDAPAPFPTGSAFPDWIARVLEHRGSRHSNSEAVSSGLREIAAAGTAHVADTVPWEQHVSECFTPPAVWPFVEYIGLSDERVQDAIRHAEQLCRSRDEHQPVGISPHAPYSVRLDLLDELVRLATSSDRAMMMHLGETSEELELLHSGTGPFADMLKRLGVWHDGLFPQHGLCDYIDRLTEAPRALIAHGNYFSQRELDQLAARPNAAVVFCPRTHSHFRHPAHPWREMDALGIPVCLGTDSRASNPDLSVWREAQYLHETSAADPATLLKMLTANGLSAVTGSANAIAIGQPATFSVLRGQRKVTDLPSSLFRNWHPVAACVNGRWTASVSGDQALENSLDEGTGTRERGENSDTK